MNARTEPVLANPRAERVKAVRALSGRSARQRNGRFLAEGPQAAREAVRCVPGQVRDLYVTAAAAARHAEIVHDAGAGGARVHIGTDEVLGAMSPDGQGVVAVVEIHRVDLATVLATTPRLVAVLVEVRDPGNAGTVVRAADAAGAGCVVLVDESVDLHNPKVVRATAGSLFHLPVVTGVGLAATVTAMRLAGMCVLAADGAGGNDLDDLLDGAGRHAMRDAGVPDLSAPTAWLFGNEARGLDAAALALADAVVRVPIHGRAESLNLATAAAVCLYASARAQRGG